MGDFETSSKDLSALFQEALSCNNTKIDLLESKYDSIDALCKKLKVDKEEGLAGSDEDLKKRKDVFGANRIPEKTPTTFWQLCLQAMEDPTLIILIVAGILSLVLGLTVEEDKSTGWIEGASILVAVFIVVMVTAVNDWQKEKQFRQLNDVKDDVEVKVVREGKTKQVSVYEVVVGDILYLAQGDSLCADGVVVDSSDLKINEAQLTGESDDIKKSTTNDPFVYGGTSVMEGYATIVVCGVGEHSQQGVITSLIMGGGSNPAKENKQKKAKSDGEGDGIGENTPLLQQNGQARVQVAEDDFDSESGSDDEEDDDDDGDDPMGGSVLQKKLEYLSVQIGYAGLFMATVTVLVLVIRFCITTYSVRGWEGGDVSILLKHFITGVTVLVVAVPEGLPLAVTISLAFSVKKMLKDNNLVRHLSACETMGNATAICSDKTGTLTTNRMTVKKGIVAETAFDSQTNTLDNAKLDEKVLGLLMEGISCNTTAEVYPPRQQNAASSGDATVVALSEAGTAPNEHVGSKTECALLQVCLDLGVEYSELRKEGATLRLIPFNSDRKRMSKVIHRNHSTRVHSKGASEVMLDLCTQQVDENGAVSDFTPKQKDVYLRHIDHYASDGLRTLVLAYKDYPEDHGISDWDEESIDDIEKNLVFLCLVGIQDPVRPEVPEAIQQCKSAGIVVRMVTGDNVTTATTIARECGILDSKNDLVMEGPEFRKKVLRADGTIDQDALDRIWPQLRVLARSSPTDKYTLVLGMLKSKLNSQPEVVAVTGDGTNDAPALKRADVGFAMGIQGTTVAKDASDIILMDDNFNSIVKAVMWGRNVYDSVSKFLQFQLTVNVVAILLAFLGACIINESPITSIQMLWINLIMDTLASLALATDSPTPDLLKRKPYGRNKAVLSGQMLQFIFGHALYQCAVVFGIIFYGPQIFGFPPAAQMNGFESGSNAEKEPSLHYTMVFNVFVMCQLFNELNARKIHGEVNVFEGVLRNPLFLGIIVFQAIVQVLIVQFGGYVFSCTPLPLHLWGWCVLIGFLELPWNFLVSIVPALFGDYKNKSAESEINPISEGSKLWIRSISRVKSQQKVVTRMRQEVAEHSRRTHRDRVLKMRSRTQRQVNVRPTTPSDEMRRTTSF